MPLLRVGLLVLALTLLHPPALHAIEIWTNCGTERDAPTFDEVARLVAPVLWFSPDEPLLGSGRSIHESILPAALPAPGQDPATSKPHRLVYYRVSQFRTASGFNARADREALRLGPGVGRTHVPLDRVSQFRIRFLFYYPDDVGFGGHQHDLESVEMTVEVERSPMPRGHCASLRLRRIAGAAHGSDWYTNTLALDDEVDDAVYPPHVLVEEGKHASAPDRNGDGWYMPGYDSTRNANDAWGVRDTLRNARLGGRQYHAENAKDRASSPKKVVPPGYLGRRHGAREAQPVPEREAWPSYEIVEAATDESGAYCEGGRVVTLPHAQRFLAGLLDQWDFCGRTQVKGPRGPKEVFVDRFWAGPSGPMTATRRDRLTLAYIVRGGNGGVKDHAVTVNGMGAMRLTLSGGWIVPRLHVTWRQRGDAADDAGGEAAGAATSGRRYSYGADLLYTSSGSRIVDWYVAMGVDGLASGRSNAFVQEVGVKLRFPSGPASWINSLVGVRFGYRGPLHRDLAGGRWVVEAGLGGW
ncbi:MAG: hypothetical protein KJ066_23840 [Acidobacteria bacterium]|nr:hypothetical protein [Acidobacteriota bacterium]